jgi:hypothetical protein
LGYYNKIPETVRAHEKKKFISHSSEKSKITMLTDLETGGRSAFWHKDTAF